MSHDQSDLTKLDPIKDLFRFMEWSDALIWRAVLSSAAAIQDSALKDKLYHIHATQHAFLQVWLQTSRRLPANDSFDMATLGRWAKSFYAEANGNSPWLDEATLNRPVPQSLMEKAEAGFGAATITPTITDTIFQVFLHTTHHRGQIRQRLRELECESPLTEYLVWVWRGRPEADWQINAAATN